jgi:hypothetical protein
MNINLSVIVGLLLIGIVIYLIATQIKDTFDQSDPMLIELQETLAPVHPIIETLQFYKGNKSYTINKEKVYICLKDKKEEYYDKNMLIYVCLHEVAHAICDEIGHTLKFHNIFQELLERAHELGIYNASIPVIQDYCDYDKE